MTTAVVLTTIVTDKASETTFMEQIFEQIRKNDKDLRNSLTFLGQEAEVNSAVFNIADFLNYADTWLRLRDYATPSRGHKRAGAKEATNGHVQPEAMGEADFMDYVLTQARQERQPAHATLTAEEQAALEDEKIGDDFSERPFLY